MAISWTSFVWRSLRPSTRCWDESPFVVAVYGDMGTEANSVASNKYVNDLVDKVDFIYHWAHFLCGQRLSDRQDRVRLLL
ncbi:hypothetical protein GQ600_10841 [Phytophthora cactorum]|nr:hypothetical protein GQ600_10841 [Phytophthora cactorum]